MLADVCKVGGKTACSLLLLVFTHNKKVSSLCKLVMIYFHELYDWVPKISTNFSLIVIASILVIATVASLLKSKKDPTAKAHAGRLTDSHDDSRS